MPHLSPMSWIIVMPALWLITYMLMLSKYQMTGPTFKSPIIIKHFNTSNSWAWMLQGGRD